MKKENVFLDLSEFLSDKYKRDLETIEKIKNSTVVKKLMLKRGDLIIITDSVLPDYGKTFYFSWYNNHTRFWSYKEEEDTVVAKGYVGINQFEIV